MITVGTYRNTILAGVIAFLGLFSPMSAQTREVLSQVSVNNITQVNNTELEFDLYLHRKSTAWERWANGTFQLHLVGVRDDEYTDANMRVELVNGSSDLQLQSYKNDVLSRYVITPRVVPGRISISVVGPDVFADSRFIPRNDSIRIGRFHVLMLDSTHLRDTLSWATPIEYYQANAYKIEKDSLVGNVLLYAENDNIEMRELPCFGDTNNRVIRTDTFVIAARPPKCLVVDTFYTVYVGERKVSIHWKTSCEQGVQGFVLRRRVKEGFCLNPSELEFHEIRRFGSIYDPEMFSKGHSTTGYLYDLSIPDTVDYRDMTYQYELSAIFFDGTRRYLDTTDQYIPNAIIVRAGVFPNPITQSTDSAVIRYMVEDDVRITAKVYDVNGRELQTLLDKVPHSRKTLSADPKQKKWLDENGKLMWSLVPNSDSYAIQWRKPEQGAQGAYFVIFIAYPIDDGSIEMSRAVVKMMVLR